MCLESVELEFCSKDIQMILKSLSDFLLKTEKMSDKIILLLNRLIKLCHEHQAEGEIYPAVMIIQMHLKNAFFNSRTIKGIFYMLCLKVLTVYVNVDDIKIFLSGIEDGSEGKSEKENPAYVFYAEKATPLWYIMVDNRDESN